MCTRAADGNEHGLCYSPLTFKSRRFKHPVLSADRNFLWGFKRLLQRGQKRVPEHRQLSPTCHVYFHQDMMVTQQTYPEQQAIQLDLPEFLFIAEELPSQSPCENITTYIGSPEPGAERTRQESELSTAREPPFLRTEFWQRPQTLTPPQDISVQSTEDEGTCQETEQMMYVRMQFWESPHPQVSVQEAEDERMRQESQLPTAHQTTFLEPGVVDIPQAQRQLQDVAAPSTSSEQIPRGQPLVFEDFLAFESPTLLRHVLPIMASLLRRDPPQHVFELTEENPPPRRINGRMLMMCSSIPHTQTEGISILSRLPSQGAMNWEQLHIECSATFYASREQMDRDASLQTISRDERRVKVLHLCSPPYHVEAQYVMSPVQQQGQAAGIPISQVVPFHRLYPCDHVNCYKIYEGNSLLWNHQLRDHSLRPLYQCTICHSRYYTLACMVQHVIGHTGHKHVCSKCGVEFKGPKTLAAHNCDVRHRQEEVTRRFDRYYKDCKLSYGELEALEDYLHSFHKCQKTFMCGGCGALYITVERLHQHIMQRHYKEAKPHFPAETSRKRTTYEPGPSGSQPTKKTRVSPQSFSPTKKGILKNNGRVSLSLSGSSMDDYVWSSSLNMVTLSGSESFIPEETTEEERESKKTVRFSEVVTQTIYRTNSSELGQRKKIRRKARNKKRCQERRASESENSEGEAEKERERETKTDDEQG